MLRRSIVGQKAAMVAAIMSYQGRDDIPRIVEAVRAEADEIHDLDTAQFARMVEKLLFVGNPERAVRLVGALGDTALTPAGLLVLLAVSWVVRAIPVAAIVLLVWWVLR